MEQRSPWRVLVVDDEEGIHSITRMIFRGYEFEGRPVELISAMSGAEARDLLAQHPDICLALLDVVMESDDEGLRLVDHIRDQLGNRDMRLILRTGHPGFAPETDVIVRYDINDYLSKAELSASRLLTSVLVALRSYRDIVSARSQQPATSPLPSSAPLETLANPLVNANQQLLQRLQQLDMSPMARDLVAQVHCNEWRLHALTQHAPTTALDDATMQRVAPRQLVQQLIEIWLPLSRQQQRLVDFRIDEPLPEQLRLHQPLTVALWSALLAHALGATTIPDLLLSLAYDSHSGQLELTLSGQGSAAAVDTDGWRQHWEQHGRSSCDQLCQTLGGALTVLADVPEQLLIKASVGAHASVA